MKEEYMRRAIELAWRGEGRVSPNPMVGCVVVKDDRIIAEGWHDRFGDYHAERNALLKLTEEEASGAELYVTLEPCCHQGKTPPCTEIIIEKHIKKVYVGSDDPNPLVAGGGIRALEAAGIEVETHVLKEECDELNEVFFYHISTKLPFIVMKYAMTLDGKINTGKPAAITGPEALSHVHKLRKRYAAIMAGVGTVVADDPMLNYRGASEDDFDYNPMRIIVDTHLRTPVDSRIVRSADEIPTVIAYTEGEQAAEKALSAAGVRLLRVSSDENGHVLLSALFKELGDEGIDSILVEGGSAVHGSLMDARLVNRVYAYISPKLFGGETALSPIGGAGISRAEDALRLKNTELLRLGEDICLTGLVNTCGRSDK